MPHTIAALALLASTLTGGGLSPATVTAAPNLRACHDGDCKLSLTRSVSFRVSSRFGITRLAISFTSDYVRVKGTGPGVASQAQLGAGTTGSVNHIGIRVLSLSGSRVVLRLTSKR